MLESLRDDPSDGEGAAMAVKTDFQIKVEREFAKNRTLQKSNFKKSILLA